MPIGHRIPKEVKAQIVTALMTQLDKSIQTIAKEFALHEWTLYQIAKQFNIRRPRGSAALSHRKHNRRVCNHG
jgi:transposase-like protein